ncbi:heterokaryon incompatibility protein [Venturia nashicola]|uniref:Heterokaryon incompatibility protein n=1 Tax=Venturia nashicola TaxID=86259 RepID=A0A4Z1NTT7_9PEZI|nr:heterokaryon incompatibility protein [Venturia nashicola]
MIPCCTTKSSLAAALSFIEYRLFPKNFQDAITITRKLRIRYIWIDSLCILQGDKHDWDVESARMADVYRNGYLTIAATSSADSTGGCFSTTRPDLCLSLINDTGEQILVGARMCDTSGLLNNETDIANRAPLFTRGWVLQEMLISRRVLLCNYGEMAFECLEAKTCECGTRSFAPHGSGSIGLTKATTEQRALMAKLLHKGHDIANLWRSMVSDYMNLTLTCPTDILQAVSACAMVTFEVTGDQYLAGMWRKSLCRELCWTNRSKRRLPRHDEWTAPTWSWASIPLGQNITTFKMALWRSFEPTIESAIGDRVITCLPKGNNKFGELTTATGQLKLDAALFPCLFRRFCKGDVSIEQPIMQRNQWGIYSEHPKPKMVATCQLPEPALNTQGGILEAFLDVPPRDALRFEIYPSYLVSTCLLASIALLHVCQIIDKKGLCLNYFMILKKVEAGHNIHERIGMALFHGHTVEQRKKWFREVWDKDIFLREEITIV